MSSDVRESGNPGEGGNPGSASCQLCGSGTVIPSKRIEHFPPWGTESTEGLNKIIHVLCLVNVPPFPCVAPEPLPLFNRESLMLADVCVLFFKVLQMLLSIFIVTNLYKV